MDLVLRLRIPPQTLQRHELWRRRFPPPPQQRFRRRNQIGLETLETTGEAEEGQVGEALRSSQHGGVLLVGDRHRSGDEEESGGPGGAEARS